MLAIALFSFLGLILTIKDVIDSMRKSAIFAVISLIAIISWWNVIFWIGLVLLVILSIINALLLCLWIWAMVKEQSR